MTLLEKLKSATGPDRELDGALWCVHFPIAADCWPHWTPEQRETVTPHYTGSIDVAAELVKQYRAVMLLGPDKSAVTLFTGTTFGAPGSTTHQTVKAPTPALALCIAAEEARLATTTTPKDAGQSR